MDVDEWPAPPGGAANGERDAAVGTAVQPDLIAGLRVSGPPASVPLAAVPTPLAVFDILGRLLDANRSFVDLARLDMAVARGQRPQMLRLQERDGLLTDLFDVLPTMPLPAMGQAALMCGDGAVRDVAWSVAPWGEPGSDGGAASLLMVGLTDITDDKCLACKIKSSREKYRQAFDQQTELVCRFTPDTRLLFVNEAYAEALGRTPRDLIGLKLSDVLEPRDARRFLAHLTGFTPADAVKDGEENYELPGGRQAVQWWRRRAIFDGDRLIAFQSVGRDITEDKRRARDRQRLERIVNASPVLGLRLGFDPGWPVEYVTDNVSRLGYSREDLMDGRVSVLDLVAEEDRERVRRTLVRAVRTLSGAFGLGFRVRGRDGRLRWLEGSFQVDRLPGGAIAGLEAVLSDVTSLMEARDRERRSDLRLRDFAEAANDWFWESDCDHRFAWLSDKARIFLGPAHETVIGQARWDLKVSIADRGEMERLRALMDARQPFRDIRYTVDLGHRVMRVQSAGRPMFDRDGRFLGYRGSACDITDVEAVERALEESNRRYRTIFDATDVALWDQDMSLLFARFDALRAEGVNDLAAWLDDDARRLDELTRLLRVRDVNQAARDMLGARDLADLVEGFLRHIQDEHGSLTRRGMLRLWDQPDTVRVEGTLRTPSGGSLEVMLSFRCPHTVEEARHVVVSVLDITARRRAERALVESETRFRGFFEASAGGMAVVDPDGRWSRVNDALCAFLRRSRGLLLGTSVLDVLHPDERAADEAWMQQALSGNDGIYDRERRLLYPDGTIAWGHVTAKLLRDGKGRPLHFVCQIHDITRRKLAEARALRAEVQLRDAIAAMEDGFVVFDADDRFVMCNTRYEQLYDRIADILVPGLHYGDIVRKAAEVGQLAAHEVPDGDIERCIEERLRSFTEGVPHEEEQLHDGRWVLIKNHRTADGGTVGVRIDITEQKRREAALHEAMEEARLADRAKSEFLANMSHELRTPLNAIIGFSEVLVTELYGPLGDRRYQDYAASIHESGRHLLQIIGDILDLSKIEAGELQLETGPVDLWTLMEGCLRMVQPRAAARHVTLVAPLSPPPALWGDALRLKQILLNLLSNAIKFSPEGGSVRVTWGGAPGGGAVIVVADRGIGMTAEEVAIAKSAFGQVQSAFSRQTQGTGLGLPITIKLVEAHGGSLDITSAKGRGTVVTLTFPPPPKTSGGMT